jgi:hypothetical protein
MVISYNQNLYFRIQCKKIQRQDYNSFHYILILQKISHNNIDMQITIEVCTSLFYLKLNKNYSKIPCSVEMKSKQKNKICVCQNRICQNMWFWVVLSHIIMIRNQQEFKIQTYNVP